MQNKGFIRIFALALALISIYELSFTFAVRNVENKAVEQSQGEVSKEYAYLDSIADENIWLGFSFKECQSRQINLGLDLKGGMNVTLEVSVPDIVNALSNYSKDATFTKAMSLARERMKDSQQDFITLFAKAFEEIDPGARLAAIFNTLELKSQISFNSSNADVIKVIRAEAVGAIDNSYNVIRTRIDRFGVAQPNIQRLGLESSGRILVELPGVKDRERVRKLLQGTANLEFWETYENSEIYPFLEQANGIVREIKEAQQAKETAEVGNTDAAASQDAEVNENKEGNQEGSDVSDLLSEIKGDTASVDSTNVNNREAFAKMYPLFSVLQPNTREGRLSSGPVVGISSYRDTSEVNSYLNLAQVRAVMPRDVSFKWTVKAIDEAEQFYQLVAIKVTSREGRAPLDGDAIVDARQGYGQTQAVANVSMSMNAEGAKTWARLTKENIGKSVAIVLDNFVYSFPTVNSEITGGQSEISGQFTVEEAQDLANVLKSGKMPAPAHIIHEAVVGPSLGQEAIDSGLSSFIIAFIVILLYMIFYYGVVAGLIADLVLIANLFFIAGVLASFNAVLTLPGIAGIILTIGTSVDANVLIYERIREELGAGKGLRKAVADGYSNAISAIIDANVTTFLTGLILFVFGTGPIKGFATTLMIGIVTSFFTAVFMSRIIFEWYLAKDRDFMFDTKITRKWFSNSKVQFIAKRKIAYAVSGTVVLLGLVSLIIHGLDQGIDFTGGRTYVVRFDDAVNTVDVQKTLTDAFDGDMPSVKTYGEDNQVKIATNYMIDSDSPDMDDQMELKLFNGLSSYLGGADLNTFREKNIMSSEKVGPTIADDIKKDAFWAVLFSLVCIFLYILMRFKNWQYSLGAVVALLHDVLIVLGLFSILYSVMPFSMEIDQAFIAAILTVIGYSINDTVVVFDRIRERFGLFPKREKELVMNEALNSTLSRTFSTSLSTFFVLLTIFMFGGEVIRGFIFALLVGVVVGTYSSLFVATPIAYDTILKTNKEK